MTVLTNTHNILLPKLSQKEWGGDEHMPSSSRWMDGWMDVNRIEEITIVSLLVLSTSLDRQAEQAGGEQ